MKLDSFNSLEKEVMPTEFPIFPPLSSNKTVTSTGDILYNKYVVIGVIVFFVLLFLVVILYNSIKAYRGRCCKKQDVNLYSHLSEDEEDDEIASLDDIEDNSLDRLYTSCQLCVSDSEVNTMISNAGIQESDCDFEYDCSSLDNSVIGLVETKSVTDDNSYDFESSLRRGSLKVLSLFKKDKS